MPRSSRRKRPVNRSRSVVPRVINPGLGGKRCSRESQPESDPEEFVWRKPAESEKHPDNRSRRRHSQSHAESANHPLAMPRHFFASNVPESLDQAIQKPNGERRSPRHFRGPRNNYKGGHPQPGKPHGQPPPPQDSS